MKILSIDDVPTDEVSRRMRAKLLDSIGAKKRSKRRVVATSVTAFALIFGGGAIASASGTLFSDANEAALDAAGVSTLDELAETGLTVTETPTVPVGVTAQEGAKLSDRSLKQLARAQILDPTLAELEAFDGFIEGSFVGDSLRWEALWHGTVPQGALDSIERAAARGVVIDVVQTQYSKAHLEQAIEDLSMEANAEGLSLETIYATDDYDGLVVKGRTLDSAEGKKLLARVAATAVGDIPVTIAPSSPEDFEDVITGEYTND